MKSLLEIFILSFFFFFSTYLPGRVIIEKFNLNREEKFVLSFGISCFLFYIYGFLIYIVNVNYSVFNGLFIIALHLVSLFYLIFRKKYFFIEDKNFLLTYFSCFLFLLFFQSFIPFYSGSLWFWDWFEHYLRTIFFLERLPLDITFLGYIIPSRPPLFNLVCFFFQSITGKDFYIYQIISTLINSLIILSVYLFCKEYFKIEKRNLFFFVIVICMLNPAILRQITYTWTKAFSAYYVIVGFYFYLKFIKLKNKTSLFLSGFLFGTGFIVHYSAGPYIVPVFLHLFMNSIKNIKKFMNFSIFFITFFLTTFTYFSWSIKNYGVKNTFLSNTTFKDQKDLNIKERVEKDLNNLFKTILPIISKEFIQNFNVFPEFSFRFHNYILSIYSSNIPGNLSFTLFIFLIISSLKKILKVKEINKFREDEKFLIFFILFSFFIGIIVNPTKDLVGVAHVTFLPFSAIILSFCIKNLLMHNKGKKIFYTFIIESLLCLFFHIYIFQNYYTVEKTIFYYKKEIRGPHIVNFALKINNNLIFIYDKIRF